MRPIRISANPTGFSPLHKESMNCCIQCRYLATSLEITICKQAHTLYSSVERQHLYTCIIISYCIVIPFACTYTVHVHVYHKHSRHMFMNVKRTSFVTVYVKKLISPTALKGQINKFRIKYKQLKSSNKIYC